MGEAEPNVEGAAMGAMGKSFHEGIRPSREWRLRTKGKLGDTHPMRSPSLGSAQILS